MRVVPNSTVSDSGFTRASAATFVNVSGVVTSAAINVLRLTFHPITNAPLGALLEYAATNLLTYSEVFENAAWAATAATVAVNATNSPSGTLTGEKLVETATTAVHKLARTAAVAVTANNPYTISVWAKSSGRTQLEIFLGNGAMANGVSYLFDLSGGTVSAATLSGLAFNTNATITAYASGWYRCSVTANVDTVSATIQHEFRLHNGTSTNYLGDGTSGVFLWGAQLESGYAPTSYIATVAAAVTRSADVLTGGTFGSSSVAEPDAGETEWNPATNYAVGAIAILGARHRKYERIIAGTTATSPHLDSTNWDDVGATNRWAMLDLYSNQQTVTAGPLVLTIAPGKRIDSVCLVGLAASTAKIEVFVGGVLYYTTGAVNTLNRNTISWSTYLFGGFSFKSTLVKFDIPPVANATVVITLTGSTVKCGGVVAGMSVYLGRAQYSATNSALNFSKIDRDDFGTLATLVPRRSVPKLEVDTEVPRVYINAIRAVRDELNAVPALYSGLDDLTDEDYFEALLILGIYREFTIDVAYVDEAKISLQLEGI